jgi:hypothetical protein
MTTQALLFGGVTYDPALDEERLTRQLGRVWELMVDGQWRTLREIAERVGGSEAGVSARLRDLRKPGFGGYKIERRRTGPPFSGLFEYRLVLPASVST